MSPHKYIILMSFDKNENLYGACLINQDNDTMVDSIRNVNKDDMLNYVAGFEKYNLHNETTIQYVMVNNDKHELVVNKFWYEFKHDFIYYKSKNIKENE